jgi:hypothetical protein
LRELMRLYVDQVKLRHGSEPPVSPSATAEQRRRTKAAAFAAGSIALEGFQTTAEVDALTREFIDGDLSLNDALKAPLGCGGER